MRPGAAVLVTVLCAGIWGTSFAVNDAGLRVLDPFAFTFWRFAVAAVGFARGFGVWKPEILRERTTWILGALTALSFILQYVGQTLTTPARTALFINSNAIVVAVLGWFVLRERPTPRLLVALGVALAGVVLLQTRGDVAAVAGGEPVGDLLTFLSGTSAAGLFVLFKRELDRWSPWTLAAGTFVAAAVILLPTAAIAAPAPRFFPDPSGLWAIWYAGLVTTTVAYGLWALALRGISPTVSAVVLLLEVAIAAVISLAIGRETFSAFTGAGAVLLLAGVTWLGLGLEAGRPAVERAPS